MYIVCKLKSRNTQREADNCGINIGSCIFLKQGSQTHWEQCFCVFFFLIFVIFTMVLAFISPKHSYNHNKETL